MRNVFILCSLVLIVACSSPKYTYHFDTHDYHSGKRNIAPESLSAEAVEIPSVSLDAETLVASGDENVFVPAPEKHVVAEEKKKAFVEQYNAMSRAERKEFRKELKSEIKKVTRLKKDDDSVKATAALDSDAKLAIIFGGIGLIFLLLPGEVFLILGAISLVIGFIFFVKWLSRQ